MTDDVSTKHPQYENLEYQWRQLRDTAAGTSNVKRSGSLYLPIPAAMLTTSATPAGIPTDDGNWNVSISGDRSLEASAPWFHPNAAYSAYVQRARFPDIVATCLHGYVGITSKKPPEISLPSAIAHLEENATKSGMSLEALYVKCIQEVILMGRYSLLVDPDAGVDDGGVTLVPYNAESYINWKQARGSLFLAVFDEEHASNDLFTHEAKDANRVLRIEAGEDDLPVYTSTEWIDGKATPRIQPSIQGKTLDQIPVVTINSLQLGPKTGPSPMIGISDIAISIYQKEADMSQSEFITCSPMLVVTGSDDDDVPGAIGSAVGWILPAAEAKVFYVEPSANCLDHMRIRQSDLMNEATEYGTALLGPSKKTAESTDTARMRQSSNSATLQSIVGVVTEGITKALRIAAEWKGANPDDVVFEPNIEFSEITLSAPEQTALLQSWLNRGISQKTYTSNLKRAGIVPDDVSVEEEINEINSQPPTLVE